MVKGYDLNSPIQLSYGFGLVGSNVRIIIVHIESSQSNNNQPARDVTIQFCFLIVGQGRVGKLESFISIWNI